MPVSPAVNKVFEAVKSRLEASGAFGAIEGRDSMLVAAARASAEPAFYRLEFFPGGTPDGGGGGRFWVSLVTPSRWLSESIESDLVEHGDDLGELIEDELIELGYEETGGASAKPTFQHFRSPEMLYTFRTPIPMGDVAVESAGTDRPVEVAAVWMLAYEQAFRRLGDMEASDE
jgi:hypothetical protein